MMMGRFVVDYDRANNEGRLSPRGNFDWPALLFARMRDVYQLAYSHDRSRIFLGTVPQVEAACGWLEREGLRVTMAGAPAAQAHPPIVCAACEDIVYPTQCLPEPGTPCQACGEPLQFVCDVPHEGTCEWQAVSA